MSQTTSEFYKGIYQFFLCLSVFILQNTNMRISSIINESPTTFLLIQRFEMDVINKCMFCQPLAFIIFDIKCTYEHSIVDYSQNTGCTPGFYFYSRYWSSLHNISHTWGIFFLRYICIFRCSRRELSVKFMFVDNFSILGAELITAYFKHDLIDKWPSASRNFDIGT